MEVQFDETIILKLTIKEVQWLRAVGVRIGVGVAMEVG